MRLTGEGGLLQQLTKCALEPALEGELTAHLGHEPGERTEGGRENYRSGRRAKTVTTELGPVEIEVPRDRAGSFEPQLVKKRQKRLGAVDKMAEPPPESGLPGGLVDCVNVEARDGQVVSRPVYMAVAVTADGHRDILNLWVGDGEGARSTGCRSSPRSRTGARPMC